MSHYRKAKKIQRLREHKRITQVWIAHQLGVAQSTYSEMESGSRPISEERFAAIARLLDTTPEWLSGPEEIKISLGGTSTEAVVPRVTSVTTPQDLMKEVTEQYGRTIKELSDLLKENQQDRARMLTLLEHWVGAAKKAS